MGEHDCRQVRRRWDGGPRVALERIALPLEDPAVDEDLVRVEREVVRGARHTACGSGEAKA